MARIEPAPASLGPSVEARVALNAAFLANRTVGWSTVAPPPSGVGVDGGLAPDPATASVLAFGGTGFAGLENSTYLYNESTNHWSNVSSSVAPSPRSDFAFGFDPNAQVGALFGGITNRATLVASNQTWKVSAHGAWTREGVGASPPAREAAAFAIDPTLGVGVLYGGWNQSYSATSSITYSDLWELNLTTWTWSQLSVTGPRPPPIQGASMTWDGTILQFVLFGGCYPCSTNVWEFDPVSRTWSEPTAPPTVPPARSGASWGYDPTLHADLLFGGTAGGAPFNDTYLFSAANDTWVRETPPSHPVGRYDAASGFLDVPGNETWVVGGGFTSGGTVTDAWRASATSNLTLLVTNASSPASPISGVQVNLSGRHVGTTNLAGFLNLTQVNAVNQPLNLTDDPWFFPENLTLWEPPGRNSSLTVELTPEPLGSVNVHVQSASSGVLVGVEANVSVDGVLVNPTPKLTNVSGNASFYGVPPGRLYVTAWQPDWRTSYVNDLLRPGGVANETLVLVPEPFLYVLAVGELTGGRQVNLEGVTIRLNGVVIGATNGLGDLSVQTDAYGASTVVGSVSGFLPAGALVDVPWTGSVNANLLAQELPNGSLLVSVMDNATDAPMPGAYVVVNTVVPLAWGSYGVSGLTDNFGLLGVNLPEGSYLVQASENGFNATSRGTVVNILPNLNVTITIFLQPVPRATVHFVVQDSRTHDPIRNASVLGGPTIGYTDARGRFNATGLIPGAYVFVVVASRYLANNTTVSLTYYENLTVVVNLTLAPTVVVPAAAWSFSLFPGSLLDLWPFLAAPAFLILGAFVYGSVRRATGPDAEPAARRGDVSARDPTVGAPETPPGAGPPGPGSSS